MARKRARLDGLDRLEMPVSWQEVDERSRGGVMSFEAEPGRSRRTRVVAAITAFAVFVPIVVFAWFALRDADAPSVAAPGRRRSSSRPGMRAARFPRRSSRARWSSADGCLFSSFGEGESLILWEDGLSYADGAVLDADGNVAARVGEAFEAGGGYSSSSERAFAEDLIGEPIPERCIPSIDADGIVRVVRRAGRGGTRRADGVRRRDHRHLAAARRRRLDAGDDRGHGERVRGHGPDPDLRRDQQPDRRHVHDRDVRLGLRGHVLDPGRSSRSPRSSRVRSWCSRRAPRRGSRRTRSGSPSRSCPARPSRRRGRSRDSGPTRPDSRSARTSSRRRSVPSTARGATSCSCGTRSGPARR